jgi:two-component system NarL family sensor kinase
VKEAINNAAKYSKASAVLLKVELNIKSYTTHIEDDGVGFDPDLKTSGNGMKTMRRRVQELGGSFFLSSCDKGKTVTLVVEQK